MFIFVALAIARDSLSFSFTCIALFSIEVPTLLQAGRPLSITFLLHSPFGVLYPMFSSRLLSFLFPLFIADIVYLSSREIDPAFSLSHAGEAFCFLAPHRRITRSALLSFAPPRHSRRPTQLQPRRNRSMNVVHLAPRRLAALNSSLLHLLRHPRVPPPTRIHDGGGRWEPAHVWAPLAGPPARYRTDSTTLCYECTYNGCHPDGFQLSVRRAAYMRLSSPVRHRLFLLEDHAAERRRFGVEQAIFCVRRNIQVTRFASSKC